MKMKISKIIGPDGHVIAEVMGGVTYLAPRHRNIPMPPRLDPLSSRQLIRDIRQAPQEPTVLDGIF